MTSFALIMLLVIQRRLDNLSANDPTMDAEDLANGAIPIGYDFIQLLLKCR